MLRRSCNAMMGPRVDSTTDQARTLQEKTSIITITIMMVIIIKIIIALRGYERREIVQMDVLPARRRLVLEFNLLC